MSEAMRSASAGRCIQYADVVHGPLLGIEVRVGPDRAQLGITDVAGVGRLLDVNRVANRRHLAGLRVDLAAVGDSDVMDLLTRPAPLVDEALDDLHTIDDARFCRARRTESR